MVRFVSMTSKQPFRFAMISPLGSVIGPKTTASFGPIVASILPGFWRPLTCPTEKLTDLKWVDTLLQSPFMQQETGRNHLQG